MQARDGSASCFAFAGRQCADKPRNWRGERFATRQSSSWILVCASAGAATGISAEFAGGFRREGSSNSVRGGKLGEVWCPERNTKYSASGFALTVFRSQCDLDAGLCCCACVTRAAWAKAKAISLLTVGEEKRRKAEIGCQRVTDSQHCARLRRSAGVPS